METDNLSIIRLKIAELPDAVMYGMNQHGVRLPSDNINFIRIDEERQLWFISHFPYRLLNECDQVFPVHLHFFKKDCDVFLEVSGRATIMSTITKPDLFIPEDPKTKKSVLIKMTMNNIEYTESYIVPGKSKLRLLAERGYKWIVRHFSLQSEHSSTLGSSH